MSEHTAATCDRRDCHDHGRGTARDLPPPPNAADFPPHEVADPPAAGDVWWRKRARYGR